MSSESPWFKTQIGVRLRVDQGCLRRSGVRPGLPLTVARSRDGANATRQRMKKIVSLMLWTAVVLLGVWAYVALATHRHEPINSGTLLVAALYRYAATGEVPSGFEESALRGAFRVK